MNLEDLIWQASRSLSQLWTWLNYTVWDHPVLALGVLVALLVLFRFLAPDPRWK